MKLSTVLFVCLKMCLDYLKFILFVKFYKLFNILFYVQNFIISQLNDLVYILNSSHNGRILTWIIYFKFYRQYIWNNPLNRGDMKTIMLVLFTFGLKTWHECKIKSFVLFFILFFLFLLHWCNKLNEQMWMVTHMSLFNIYF